MNYEQPTIAPSEQAGEALVGRLKEYGQYQLEAEVNFSRVQVDPLEAIDCTRVDVVVDTEKQLAETLDFSDNTSHKVRVWLRSRLPQEDEEAIRELTLMTRQLFIQMENWNSLNNVVQVWECDIDDQESPLKAALKQAQLFVASITLRVEVKRPLC